MTNSFTLGLLHGVLYGLTPTLVLVAVLNRYHIEGPVRGRLARVGTIIGQLLFLSLPLFGWKHLLWVWYYCEPFLIFGGTVALLSLSYNNWHSERFYQGFLASEMSPAGFQKRGYGFQNPQLLPGEPIYHIGVHIVLMFCNPTNPSMVQALVSTLPSNKLVYLLAFTLGYAPLVFLIWDFMGHKLEKFIRESNDSGVQVTISKGFALIIATLLAAQLNGMNYRMAFYPTDNVFAYTPFNYLRSREAMYLYDRIYTREERAAFFETASESEAEDREKKEKIPFLPEDFGANAHSYRPTGRRYNWDLDRSYNKVNEDRKIEMSSEVRTQDQSSQHWEILWGISRGMEQFRIFSLYAFYMPEWEHISNMERLDDLYNMRRELDAQLGADPNLYRVYHRLPQHRFISDLRARPVDENDPTKLEPLLNNYPESMYGVEHTLRDPRIDDGLVKVHPLPAKVRLPWHFPALEEPSVHEEANLAADFLVTPDRHLSDPDYKASAEGGASFLVPRFFDDSSTSDQFNEFVGS